MKRIESPENQQVSAIQPQRGRREYGLKGADQGPQIVRAQLVDGDPLGQEAARSQFGSTLPVMFPGVQAADSGLVGKEQFLHDEVVRVLRQLDEVAPILFHDPDFGMIENPSVCLVKKAFRRFDDARRDFDDGDFFDFLAQGW